MPPIIDTNVDSILRNLRSKPKKQTERSSKSRWFHSWKSIEVIDGILRKANRTEI